jgi:hypothetical protein
MDLVAMCHAELRTVNDFLEHYSRRRPPVVDGQIAASKGGAGRSPCGGPRFQRAREPWSYLLTADIGGTNARFGLVPKGELRPAGRRIMYTADSPSPEAAARQFLAEMGDVKLIGAVIAWAGHIGPARSSSPTARGSSTGQVSRQASASTMSW